MLACVRPPVVSAAAGGPPVDAHPYIGAAAATPGVNLQPIQDPGVDRLIEEDELLGLLEEYAEFASALEQSLAPPEEANNIQPEQ